jgi:hypothetical protein
MYKISPKMRLHTKPESPGLKAVKDGVMGTKYSLSQLQGILQGGKAPLNYASIASGTDNGIVAPLPADYLKLKKLTKLKRAQNGAARKRAKELIKLKKLKTIKKLKVKPGPKREKHVGKPDPKPKIKPGPEIDVLTGYYHLNGDSHQVVRKRAHSKAYRTEFNRCKELEYTRIRGLKRARAVASKEIKRWESVVQP